MPDIIDFMHGISSLLNTGGMATIEFQHVMSMLKGNQFDTIYHEHYSYLSLSVVQKIAAACGLSVVDVDRIKTHGGSLRVWLAHQGSSQSSASVETVLLEEQNFGLENITSYNDFHKKALDAKFGLLRYLMQAKDSGLNVLGYGAAAKGSTLLNFAGIKSDLLTSVADLAPSKQGKYFPGSHIPIISPNELHQSRPDQILVFPWNIIDEIKKSLSSYELVTAIPFLTKHSPSRS